MSDFVLKHGNNIPIQAPLIPDPFVPYECKGYRSVFAVCRGDESVIRKYLEPTPFDYVDNTFIVSVSDFSNCNKVSFMDCAIVIPVKYKDIYGGYYLFEYENDDSAIAAGRDLWGYPKKYADITLQQENGKVKGQAVRKGQLIVDIECDLNERVHEVINLQTYPHLNLHVVPKPDGKGISSMKVISRDTSPDFKLISEELGKTTVYLNGLPTDPLHELQPIEVLGGGYTVGDFYATEENGWGRIIETLI
jgi:acetoacetate decarboxylase